MIDELLGRLVGEAIFGRYTSSDRAKLIYRVFFGLLGGVLALVGAIYILTRPGAGSAHMRLAMAALFLSFAALWILNVALLRQWRWPGALTVASLVALIAARFILGP